MTFDQKTRKLPLHGKYGAGRFVLVSDKDYEYLSQFKWYVSNTGYPYRMAQMVMMHREITDAPSRKETGLVVDHINGNKLDNRRANLQIVTQSENCLKAVRKPVVFTEQMREEARRRAIGNTNHCTPVTAIDKNGEVFDFISLTEAQEKLGVLRTAISNCLKGLSKTAGGYHWQYRRS